MNQKQLTQAIREGLNQSRDDFCKEIFKALLWSLGIIILVLLVLIFVVIPIWEKYHPPTPTQIAPLDTCKTKTGMESLTCEIKDKDKLFCYEFGEGYINGVKVSDVEEEKCESEVVAIKNGLCGHQEANAWFEQYKNRVRGNFYLECNLDF